MNWLHVFWYGLLDFFGIRNEAGPGYGFWSGFAGDLTLITGATVYLRHRNCHVKGCKAIRTHPVLGTPYIACRKHHPHIPDEPITPEIIESAAAAIGSGS
jgi:hypothetical protein